MPLPDVALPRMRPLFETNVFAVVGLTNAMLPLLLAASPNGGGSGGGLVVNISSASDRLPFPFKGSYAMTKAALSSYSRTLSVELAPLGVRVLNVVTAFIRTQLGRRVAADPWPEDSLFRVMEGTGQAAGSGHRMPAEQYARRVVAEALRGPGWEVGPWRFGGTQETMMLGAMSWPMWILGWLGEGWARWAMLKMWPFWMLRDAQKGKKRGP